VVLRAAAAYRNGVKALTMPKLTRAFLTHLHSDHTAGYPDLILTPWVLEREQPLEVYGPKGLKAMTKHILKAYQDDINIRLNGLEPANETGYKVKVSEIKPGVIYTDKNVTVRAFPVKHGSWPQAFGYRFDTPDRSIVISGDCAPSESVVDNCNGCDVLIHEVMYLPAIEKLLRQLPNAKRLREHLMAAHTLPEEVGKIAAQARVKTLVLSHFVPGDDASITDEQWSAGVRKHFTGRVVVGRDLMEI